MATAGSIVVDLLMRTGSFETDTARAEKRLKQLQRQIDDTAKKIGTAFGAGVAVAVGALATLTIQSVNYADQLDELSNRLGISTEQLSAWGYAAKLTGSDLDSLASTIPRLSKNLAGALDEGSRQADLFKALGIEVTDAAGRLRDVEDVLPEIADRFKELKNDTTEAALAQELFGKSGAEFLEFLNLGSDGLPRACPTLIASPASRIDRRRDVSHSVMALLFMPVQAEMPLPMEFWVSLPQRSPHRLVVALALSITLSMRTMSWTRGVMRPCTSPTRKIV